MKVSKNQRRRQLAKLKRSLVKPEVVKNVVTSLKEVKGVQNGADDGMSKNIEIEIDMDDPMFQQFQAIFAKFEPPLPPEDKDEEVKVFSNDESDSEPEQAPEISKRQKRLLNKIPLSVLKSELSNPELVEWYDADAPDPRFLVYIKSLKNVIPVPSHWTLKREYLSNKRSNDRNAFQLPQFILDTGIADMRDPLDDDENLKKEMRLRVQPKMGKLDLDYNLLHNAFFRQQTKPKLYNYGDLYFEGKEFESKWNYDKFKPGQLSLKLTSALGLRTGESPPWVRQMEKYGPPPSYPDLNIDTWSALNVRDQLLRPHWAELIIDEEEEEEDEDEDEEILYEQESDHDEVVEAIPITEIGGAMKVTETVVPEDSDRPLYEVIQQDQNRYKLPSGDVETVEKPQFPEQADEREVEEKFKF